MIKTHIIDGKAFAANLRADIAKRVAKLKAEKGITPGLAVVLVGSDPASEVYVKSKGNQTLEAGMNSYEFKLPESTTEAQLLEKVHELNNNREVHGILVQLPLPKHINEDAIINAISPDKDVDGFHVINAGRLATGQEAFVPCTPLGCLMLLKDYYSSTRRGEAGRGALVSPSSQASPLPNLPPKGEGILSGLHAVVIGRSNIVGKPMAALLLAESCTVTIAHSKTANLPDVVKLADIVVAAVGRPQMVKGEWLKAGAVVIDVGINRLPPPTPPVNGGGKNNLSPLQAVGTQGGRLVGDVDFESCLGVASAITPVPGGVGPMTIACLLENTLNAANK